MTRDEATWPSDPRFAALDAAIAAGIGPLYPGAVLAIARHGRIVHGRALGHARLLERGGDGRVRRLPAPQLMRTDTIFDLASVTKVAATTLAVMRLVDAGTLRLNDRLATLLPGFAAGDKRAVTLRDLLAHRAGLWEWQPTWVHGRSPDAILPYLAALPRRYPVGARHAYSDLGFMLLGAVVARASGRPLDRYVREAIFAPFGMGETGYRPDATARARCAATSRDDVYQRRMAERGEPYPAGPIAPPADLPPPPYRAHALVGEANDANAALGWDGVAGHAGLFGTAADLLRLTEALIVRDGRLAAPATFAAFEARPHDPGQALGWRAYSVAVLAEPFFGHPGFTGTFVAWSRALGAGAVLLTNRLHRDARADETPPPLGHLHDRLMAAMAAAFA